ncbi:IS3 family transposase [Microbulbifer spongiae]|uniref:IS3 family transposase n=1 Tax=Microbulbifer spongiae TaxID=2944933 RepID=UPI00345F0CD1
MELHQGFRKAYGARRVHQQLKRSGLSCSVRRVFRLMKTVGIKASSRWLYT